MNESYFTILPPELVSGILRLPEAERTAIQEIRLRSGYPATYLLHGQERMIPAGLHGFVVKSADLTALVNRATNYCTYASTAQLKHGFLTLPGGHRLGVCGQVVMEASEVRTLRELTSVNLRIARQIRGKSAKAIAFLRQFPSSTLIAGPPGCGKTTLLRELILACSEELAQRVGIVDERMELAACCNGIAGFCVGRMTDVLSGVPKQTGVYMLLRTMNPDWIAVDEITDERDVDALLRSSFCGVRILASAHIFSRSDLYTRPLYAKLCASGLFENLILMDKQHGITMERMNANDKTLRSSLDCRVSSLRGDSDGTQCQNGGTLSPAASSCA